MVGSPSQEAPKHRLDDLIIINDDNKLSFIEYIKIYKALYPCYLIWSPQQPYEVGGIIIPIL